MIIADKTQEIKIELHKQINTIIQLLKKENNEY